MKQIKSPNFFKGHKGYKRTAIVLHVSTSTLASMDSWFSTPKSQVSAHYGIGNSGEVHQYVSEENSSWAVGGVKKPTWALLKKGVNPNYYTISIEFEGLATNIWSDEMKASGIKLIKGIAKRHNIPLIRENIIGHYEIDNRKPFIGGHVDRILSLLNKRKVRTPYEILMGVAKTLPPVQANLVRMVARIILAFSKR